MIVDCQSGRQIEVLDFIDKGGMAVVHRAKFVDDGSTAIVKFPRNDAPNEAVALFMDEAHTASSISHENVVNVLDWGKSDNFIVFEVVDGGNLGDLRDELIRSAGRMELDDFRNLAKQLCAGLIAIHTKVIHRDLKPENVLLSDSGMPKISDFGLSKYIDESTRSVTFKGWGSPGYRAPEMLLGGSVDRRADQLGLGIMFYEFLVGARAYSGPDWEDQERYHIPKRVSDVRNDVPVSVSTVIARMMAKRPNDRFDSVEEACAQLANKFDDLSNGNVSEVTKPEDSENPVSALAKIALEATDVRRRKELEIEQTKAESERKSEQRSGLFDFEFGALQKELSTQVEAINKEAGEDVLAIHEYEHMTQVSIEEWVLEISGKACSTDNSHYMGWGKAVVWVPGARGEYSGYCATHFVLDLEEPYPEWATVILTISPLVDPRRASTEIGQIKVGNLIVVTEESGLMFARKMKGIPGTTRWEESEYSHSAFVAEHLKVLLDSARSNPK